MNDWELKKLSEICKVNYGQSPTLTLSEEGNIPVIGTGNEIRYGNKFLYDGESIILGRKGTIDNPIYVSDKFWAIDTAFYLSNFLDADVKWLYYYLLSRKSYFVSEATGVPSISRSFLYDLEINTPPKKEQSSIAQILSTVDKAIEHSEKLIAKYQHIKTGLMQDLLTKGIDEHGNIRSEKTHKFKNSPLGRIPVEWEIVELGNICDMKGRIGWQGYTINDLTDDSEAPTVIGGTQISKENKLDFTKSVHLKRKKYLEAPEIFVNTGDIVLVKTGNTIGKTALVENQIGEATINPNTILLKNFKNVINKYLFLIMISDYFQKSLWDFVFVGAQPSVNQANMKTIKLPIPKGNEQKLIIESFDSLSIQIEEQKKKLFKHQSIKSGLMQDLLTGKVRVN